VAAGGRGLAVTTGGSSTGAQFVGQPRLALVLCGALAREVRDAVQTHGWQADLYAVPDRHHMRPGRILSALEKQLQEIAGRYERIVVVYGDCGTAGALDELIERYGAVRLPGAHCYELFAGADFARLVEEEPATYFLTDFLVRHWETTVLAGLGLDHRPELRQACFGSFKRLVYLRQSESRELEIKARDIAAFLDLPLEIRGAESHGLEHRLEQLIES
jgi:hypothetical protein